MRRTLVLEFQVPENVADELLDPNYTKGRGRGGKRGGKGRFNDMDEGKGKRERGW